MRIDLKTKRVFGLLVFGLIFFLSSPCLSTNQILIADAITCDACKKTIRGQFIRVDKKSYHPRCLVCEKCKKKISGPIHKLDRKLYHPFCFRQEKGLYCAYCNKILDDKWVVSENRNYHQDCLKQYIHFLQPKCGICGSGISGRYVSDDSDDYHIECYKNTKLPKCNVCSLPIEDKLLKDPWGNQSHIKHGKTEVRTCSSCSRIISQPTSNGGYEYRDGRSICAICKKTSIETAKQIQPSTEKIVDLFRKVGISGIPTKKIPVYLVDKKKLKKLTNTRHSSNTKGFTKSISKYINGNQIEMNHSVFILSGLPKTEFEGVLAHELLHVWLKESEIELSSSNTEGFCNLGSMLVYENSKSKFAQILLENMENDPDRKYGRGYRKMKKKLNKWGWKKLLRNL